MRYLQIIFLFCLFGFSCTKKKLDQGLKNPIPEIAYKDFQAWKAGNRDTALITIGYSDGDGNLIRNSTLNGPNLVFLPYYFNPDSNKLILNQVFSYVITQQPLGNFCKVNGTTNQGDITIYLNQFRPNDNVKVMKFDAFMVDMAGNKSNVVSTPQFTFNF
jgi:hypothetical protein